MAKKSGGCAFFVNENNDSTVKQLGDQMEGLIITINLKLELQVKLHHSHFTSTKKMFNQGINLGYFPSEWKLAKMKTLFKNG